MDLVNLADQALYIAKESGRNRVVCFDSDSWEVPSQKGPSEAEERRAPLVDIPTHTDGEMQQLREQIQKLEAELAEQGASGFRRSLHDELTGLPNRMLLVDRAHQAINRAKRSGGVLAAISIELDILQRVNDAFGRQASDELLISLSDRLNRIFRTTDTVGMVAYSNESTLSRVGANEFVILCSDIVNIESVPLILRRIKQELASPLSFATEEMLFSGNIGISVFPHDADDVESLLETAASARCHARSNDERINVAFYSKEMNRVSKKQLRMETLLHKAIGDGEYLLLYQPKLDLKTGQIRGVEALIRWKNEELGMVSPLEFVPVLEQCGLIPQVTDWVLNEVCRQLKVWDPLGLTDIRVAINVSPVDLRDKGFASRFIRTLEKWGISPRALEVEITETGVIQNMKTAVQSLQELQARGIQLSLDDFGTGYSSLSHLNALPLNVLKIDGCFIKDLHLNESNQAIVKAIVAMASTAGLRILAEGVEDEQEFRLLKEFGCQEIQGYLISPPISPEEVAQFILARNASGLAEKQENRVVEFLPRWLARRG
jgi:diguanylate cyclase (GGDEF)-like protein